MTALCSRIKCNGRVVEDPWVPGLRPTRRTRGVALSRSAPATQCVRFQLSYRRAAWLRASGVPGAQGFVVCTTPRYPSRRPAAPALCPTRPDRGLYLRSPIEQMNV